MTRAIVYIQQGCPACHEYLPRVRAAAAKSKTTLSVVDVNTPAGNRAAEKHSIRSTPTTDFFSARGGIVRRIGNLQDAALERILQAHRPGDQAG